MASAAHAKFLASIKGANTLAGFHGSASAASPDQASTNSWLLSAALAQGVGCWEGYLEAVIREFVSKTRVQTHRRAWTLIVQFESIVDKMASELNTPNWDKCRDLLLVITGLDVYSSWIWSPKFSTQTDTKSFFDGILTVRHSFAHGFAIPANIPGLSTPGVLDPAYVAEATACLQFFVDTTDRLLEHELTHRHGCMSGWN